MSPQKHSNRQKTSCYLFPGKAVIHISEVGVRLPVDTATVDVVPIQLLLQNEDADFCDGAGVDKVLQQVTTISFANLPLKQQEHC